MGDERPVRAGSGRSLCDLYPHVADPEVLLRNGERIVEDGPFDTKEQLGGYFVIDVAELDAALDWAAKAPLARTASVEAPPMLPMPLR